jgi:asparagine synthase (glutamine-hydrolysing)
MCGIVGMVAFGGAASMSEHDADVVLESIEHRGPDDEGRWWSEDRRVFLGHRRLSIIDLSEAGHQPMSNEDGTLWIVYNGEVYNFAELREELVARGHVFRSRTDTEVLIHGYEQYGAGIVEKLRGMFAFAIYDTRRRRLFLARDRMGIKPLYYTWVGETFCFASEIRPLLEMPGVRKALSPSALREYLAFGKVYAPNTMFEGIMKFPAAHHAAVERRTMEPRRYWSPYGKRIEFPENAGEEYYAGRLLELLEESVKLRMISDVPVGVFLSGGVDSTANVALMSRVAGSSVHTFTAGFRGEERFDEREYARAAARHFNTVHDEVEITAGDLVDALPTISSFLDEPVADPTVIPLFFLSKLAREKGAIVILNGDGADELFSGYGKYMRYRKLFPYWRALQGSPAWARRLAAKLSGGVGGGVVADLLDRAALGVEMYVGATGPLKGTRELARIMDGDGGARVYDAVREGREIFARERLGSDDTEWLSYWGLRSEVEHVFLYRADRMGMASSIEVRVPFLDHRLVEFAMQMPQELKYRGGETKYILKKALEGTVPDEFLYRRKQGFCVPLRQWAGPMMDVAMARVIPRINADWGLLDEDFLHDVRRRMAADPGSDASGALSWMLYNFSIWYERWFA